MVQVQPHGSSGVHMPFRSVLSRAGTASARQRMWATWASGVTLVKQLSAAEAIPDRTPSSWDSKFFPEEGSGCCSALATTICHMAVTSPTCSRKTPWGGGNLQAESILYPLPLSSHPKQPSRLSSLAQTPGARGVQRVSVSCGCAKPRLQGREPSWKPGVQVPCVAS